MPLSLTIDGVISDTPISYAVFDNVTGLVSTATSFFGNSSRSKDAYDALMKLRDKREPFDVVTGLRVYKNMVFENLNVDRTAQTGNAIHFSAVLKEIVVARTKKVSPPLSDTVSDLAGKKTDFGKIISDIVPPGSPLAAGTGVLTSGTQGKKGSSFMFDIYNNLL
jgi:hypothetical protein